MQNKRIVFQNESGGVSVIVPAPGATFEELVKAVPPGVNYDLVDADLLSDRTFRDAWIKGANGGVDHCIVKCKNIAHNKRRAKRAEEFAPLDVQATVPALANKAEQDRQVIRDKYADLQIAIDSATTVEELKVAAKDVL